QANRLAGAHRLPDDADAPETEPPGKHAVEAGGDDPVADDDVRVLRDVDHLEGIGAPSDDHPLGTAADDHTRRAAVRVREEPDARELAFDADDPSHGAAPRDHRHVRL